MNTKTKDARRRARQIYTINRSLAQLADDEYRTYVARWSGWNLHPDEQPIWASERVRCIREIAYWKEWRRGRA